MLLSQQPDLLVFRSISDSHSAETPRHYAIKTEVGADIKNKFSKNIHNSNVDPVYLLLRNKYSIQYTKHSAASILIMNEQTA